MDFLGAHVGPTDVVFEWGSGGTTAYLATRCKRITTVEHQGTRAAEMILAAHNAKVTNLSVLHVPPDLPYVEGTADDGDLSTFRSYIECFTGKGVDVVVLDGRARVEAARFVAERAPFGPHPELKVFLHDCDRPAYAEIVRDTVIETEEGDVKVDALFFMEAVVERLALLRPFQR